MKTVGIIAEFNPFHNGHAYLLRKAKEITGAEAAVVIMSGDFVQRGAPAICCKYLRTEAALDNGADIVFELPVRYACSSAESFAEGAVRLLASTGIIDCLVFGSETGNISEIRNFAELLDDLEESDEYHSLILSGTKSGLSFPAARAQALKKICRISVPADSPNNTLATEYCRALNRLKKQNCPHIPEPFTIKREGSAYSATGLTRTSTDEGCEMASATALRNIILSSSPSSDLTELSPYIPEGFLSAVRTNRGKLLPVTENDFSDMLYMRLCTADEQTLHAYSGINGDLLNAILKRRHEQFTVSELISDIKNKAFTYSAISRAVFRILLGLCNSNDNSGEKPYLRLLGFNRRYSSLLRNIRDYDGCDLITKPADFDRSSTGFAQDIFAADLFSQILYSGFGFKRCSEFERSPIMK